ncbi:RagB/SusD family nutrient uptake outer membrane protein [Solitalea canadensis]|uniref:RagB/SusD family protein n=1 Tax=Solitalea canadensis (strain ATCC 29591 / DSM 3403 / JCM 21819 / LMG 8368 / NBRC 15130 / NCIMB 12057 / USAM 9D) TaxID=929556 RepID=H8KUN6_SOLCM|nr:RagB/SusD family nutrient uptake outer membrane protein [Solitalea canadensis]AFD07460.1 RagB/SusD family protein [Solitalea canadensis DSM 3403]
MKLFNNKHTSYLLKVALIALPLTGTLSSCKEDFLEAKPELNLPADQAFDTPARILLQVNGLYSSAKNGSLFGGRYMIYNDIRGEEFVNNRANGVTGYSVWQQTQTADDNYITNIWSQGYLTINRVNQFLEGLEANSSKIEATLATNYKGEAKFIRALTYFSLVQVFAKPYQLDQGASKGLPLRLKAETTTANNALKRSSVAEIYAQILKDLDEAETELPDNYGTDAERRTTRAHKNSARALKTRVYLAKGDYAKVITEANKIVPATAPFVSPIGVSNALNPSVTTTYTSYTTLESIFSFPMAVTNVPGTQNQLGYYFNTGGGANLEYFLNKSSNGIWGNAQFRASDDRRTKLIGGTAASPCLIKYSNVSPFLDYTPMIRYAEVLLNLAEAEAEVGDQVRARALLDAVHKRSDPTYDFGTLDKDALIISILTERRIELLGEGFRANDAVRRLQPIKSLGAGADIPPSDARYNFAIPALEVRTNSAIND